MGNGVFECYAAPDWNCRVFELASELDLSALAIKLPVREIYQDVLDTMGLVG